MVYPKVLVIGANGQIGTVLTQALRLRYGSAQVIAADLNGSDPETDPYYRCLDATDKSALERLILSEHITHIYLLAAILSARGEQSPLRAWQVNMDCLFNCLEVSVACRIERLFYPSTIAVFGSDTPRFLTPQHTITTPATVYGMSKLAGELWCNYYFSRYGLDVRSLRYPGIIGYQSLPGGGTTDYAVEIFHQALQYGRYTCFLSADTRLPMMYMDDAIRATIELMEAPAECIRLRTSYNLAAMSFTPAELAQEIQKHIKHFEVAYVPDYRQEIAATWPEVIDDSVARRDWGWQHRFGLSDMVADMLDNLAPRYK